MIYRSKIDTWIAVVLIAGGCALMAGILPAVLQHDFRALLPIGGVLVLGFVVMWPLYYEITDDELTIRSGLVRWHIPLSSIVRVRPSNSLISSPALSLDRLEVAYEKNGALRRILISPKERENFLVDLRSRAPQLRPTPDGLTKQGAYIPL